MQLNHSMDASVDEYYWEYEDQDHPYMVEVGRDEVDEDYFDEQYGEQLPLQQQNGYGYMGTNSRMMGLKGWSELDISRMGLRSISSGIGNFTHLTALYLNNNKITILNDDIFQNLRSLMVIDLSYNSLVRLPTSFTYLISLEKAYLNDNQLMELPVEMGRLYKLKELTLSSNPISIPPPSVTQLGADAVLSYLRDRMPAGPPPPERRFITAIFDNQKDSSSFDRDTKVRVFSYNVLADLYVTADKYNYCPSWALDWDYRKQGILKEMLQYDCDVLCLQEVEALHYEKFFLIEMSKAGYSGLFAPKSRARTMEDWSSVDGCAIFFKRNRFSLVEDHIVEFQSISMSKHKEFADDPEAFSRLITKDNIAVFAILQIKENNDSNPSNNATNNSKGPGKSSIPSKPKYILIANTHIHWNPEHRDVKLMQVQFLLEQLANITSSKSKWYRIPMIVCGDFNSGPDSGPYELLSKGNVPPRHQDLEPFYYGTSSALGMKHPFSLASAYGAIGEPPFTNYTGDFVGILDYIWFTQDSLAVSTVLEPVDEETVKMTRLPNAFINSDHISILAEFMWKKNKWQT